jgi:hypothetical protein
MAEDCTSWLTVMHGQTETMADGHAGESIVQEYLPEIADLFENANSNSNKLVPQRWSEPPILYGQAKPPTSNYLVSCNSRVPRHTRVLVSWTQCHLFSDPIDPNSATLTPRTVQLPLLELKLQFKRFRTLSHTH